MKINLSSKKEGKPNPRWKWTKIIPIWVGLVLVQSVKGTPLCDNMCPEWAHMGNFKTLNMKEQKPYERTKH